MNACEVPLLEDSHAGLGRFVLGAVGLIDTTLTLPLARDCEGVIVFLF